MDLQNKIILMTGAGQGIGRAVAKEFATHGATVILLDRDLSQLEEVYDEIQNGNMQQAAIFPMNLETSTPKDYQQLFDILQQEFGHLHGLIHNAAILGALCPIEYQDIETWYKVLQVNLNAPFLLTKACLPLLQKPSKASILFTSDELVSSVRAYWGAYGVSKFGVEGLSKILAEELDNSNIRVNCIRPNKIRTKLRAHAYPGENPQSLTSPNDITWAYRYLMSDESKEHGLSLNLSDIADITQNSSVNNN